MIFIGITNVGCTQEYRIAKPTKLLCVGSAYDVMRYKSVIKSLSEGIEIPYNIRVINYYKANIRYSRCDNDLIIQFFTESSKEEE